MGSAVVTLAGAEALSPGEPGVVVVTVTKVGSTVEAYDVAVLGELAPFATVAPPTLRLLPGQQEAATVTLVVGSENPSGAVPFGVKVHAQSAGGEGVVEERELQVMPVADITIRTVPMVLRTRRRGEPAWRSRTPATPRRPWPSPSPTRTRSCRPRSARRSLPSRRGLWARPASRCGPWHREAPASEHEHGPPGHQRRAAGIGRATASCGDLDHELQLPAEAARTDIEAGNHGAAPVLPLALRQRRPELDGHDHPGHAPSGPRRERRPGRRDGGHPTVPRHCMDQ